MAITKDALQKMADLHSVHVEHDYRLMGGSKEQTPRTPMSEVFDLALANLETQEWLTPRCDCRLGGINERGELDSQPCDHAAEPPAPPAQVLTPAQVVRWRRAFAGDRLTCVELCDSHEALRARNRELEAEAQALREQLSGTGKTGGPASCGRQ
jgi:hypothetical protein